MHPDARRSAAAAADPLLALLTVAIPLALVLLLFLTARALLRLPARPIRGVAVPVFSAVLVAAFFKYAPLIVEDALNSASLPVHPRYRALADGDADSAPASAVSDLHCDAMLWTSSRARSLLHTSRHPLRRERKIGCVDVPRLIAGRVEIQVFAAVVSVPRVMSWEENTRPRVWEDAMAVNAFFGRWPLRTWTDEMQRVLFQFQELHRAAEMSKGRLVVARSGADVPVHSRAPPPVVAVLAVEGLSCLRGNVDAVDELFRAGARILGPTHFFDTESGSLSGLCNCGMTEFGRHVMERMRKLEMIVDLSHSSRPLMRDIMHTPAAQRPALLISHTGLNTVCPHNRNLLDEDLAMIAGAGGLVGIALFEPALCGGDIIGSFVKSVLHARDVIGIDKVALGSDWDGKIHTSVSAEDTSLLSSALLHIGNLSRAHVTQVMTGNARSFLARNLPSM